MTLKKWIIDLFKDERGSTSIKPVIAIMGALFLCAALIINSLTSKPLNISDALVNAIAFITAIGMGADSVDKFSFKDKNTNT